MKMDFQIVKLDQNDLLPQEERQAWEKGVFVGKEKGSFHVDLPENYDYNQDFRLQGTNSFVIKTQDFIFTIVGEEVQKSFHLHENERDKFEDSIKGYLDKIFVYLKSNGIDKPENLKLYRVEAENFSWYRANYSYEMNDKIFSNTYNLLGKVFIKLFAGKTLKNAGYGKGRVYREHKIIDFLSVKIENKDKYFALAYTFDDVNTRDLEEMVKIINEISMSLGYYIGGY
jgi:hypothetical protein